MLFVRAACRATVIREVELQPLIWPITAMFTAKVHFPVRQYLAGRSIVGQSRISTRFEKPSESRLGNDMYKANGSARSLRFLTDLCLIQWRYG
jgi:hypothetical protein